MGDWAERTIIRELQEEHNTKQNKISLQEKIAQEKRKAVNVSALRFFSYGHIDYERFWKFIAYTYFVGKTLGLLILIGLLFFGKLTTVLFTFIFLGCTYVNLKLYKRRKISTQTPSLLASSN